MSSALLRRRTSARARVLVAAKAGDPLLMEGRARLIWAANTAEALTGLNCEAWLTGQNRRPQALKSTPSALAAVTPDQQFKRFYGTTADFRVVPSSLPRWLRVAGPAFAQLGFWEVNYFLPRQVFPLVDAVHTRDFRVAAKAVRRGLPTIYEDHNESFHRSITAYPSSITRQPAFRLAVAPTSAVRDRMIAHGMPEEKVMVAWSGLNARSLQRAPRRQVEDVRATFLRPGHQALVTYCGGLHACRGIDFILKLAGEYPLISFLILGGREAQAEELRLRVRRARLLNVSVLGYRPQVEVPGYLQASDAVLLPYNDPLEAKITSPLKFFEYLASGAPIVSSRLPELREFHGRADLAIEWCDVCDYASFRGAFAALRERFPSPVAPSQANIEQAGRYTWHHRQRLIMDRTGLDYVAAREELEVEAIGAIGGGEVLALG